ncbi:Ig domain-containing protein [Pontiellaceae bacterium B1224]|nr:Ig domain-containing protein [Pontiellaceae bacterium B1224]
MKIISKQAIMLLSGVWALSAVADITNVQIKAFADTDYGTDNVATLVSDVLTAPDGLATFQIAFNVTPPASRSIRSGITGSAGASTSQSWGIGPENTLFNGDDSDRVEEVGNLQITNFNANGGAFTLESFSGLFFKSVELANAQSGGKDAVQFIVNGSATNNLGNLTASDTGVTEVTANLHIVDLEMVGGVSVVTNFALGTSSTNTLNKWSVNHVEVAVDINNSNTVVECTTGGRADWMRGTWGINWKPTKLYSGRSENLTIDAFLDQISDLRTLDYLQLHLGDSYIFSPVHIAPHDLLESLWQGDVDTNGIPINLVVPRAAAGIDPFLEMLKATKAAGLRTQIYVNSSQMLQRGEIDNPAQIPDITERWKNWCDTNTVAQAFISSQSYHTDGVHSNRPYMFCYAEFVLKEYAIRYGDLIDAWLFDSGSFMANNGDNATNGVADDQRIYGAFADACHAGNTNAAVAFNNGPERDTEEQNPFSEATHYDDYMFGHPYNGGNQIGSHTLGDPPQYDRNYAHIQKVTETCGNVHAGESTHDWTWDDLVVGHFDPPMSTTAWNGGGIPALTDEEFLLWNLESAQGGGAISWGGSLIKDDGDFDQLLLQAWAMDQLSRMDAHLRENESPGAPNWARAYTSLPDAEFGQPYSHTLVDGVDFWDPETNAVALSLLDAPAWLTLEEDALNPGDWILSGLPTETSPTVYEFKLLAADASGATEREVMLTVDEPDGLYPFKASANVFAVANHNYGTDNVATMVSDLQTAPDGLATFNIALDVTPMAGTGIRSGTAGNSQPVTSWGVNTVGSTSPDNQIFKGSENESVVIGNIRISNFDANGGMLSAGDFSDLSFEFISIANGQSSGDRVLAVVNGVTNSTGGVKMSNNSADYDLRILGYIPITNVVLAVGNDLTTCKWAVNSIQVKYAVSDPGRYAAWATSYGLVDGAAQQDADTENGGLGDGYDNLAEYALGMNPTVADAGSKDWINIASEGGTNWFEYVHNRRSDYSAQGLSYLLIDSTNLVSSVSNTNGQDQILVGPAVGDYESVTNRYPSGEAAKFIQLIIQQD